MQALLHESNKEICILYLMCYRKLEFGDRNLQKMYRYDVPSCLCFVLGIY